jgi:hypothetical protein
LEFFFEGKSASLWRVLWLNTNLHPQSDRYTVSLQIHAEPKVPGRHRQRSRLARIQTSRD